MTIPRASRLLPLIAIVPVLVADLASAVPPATAAPGLPDLATSITASPNPVLAGGTKGGDYGGAGTSR